MLLRTFRPVRDILQMSDFANLQEPSSFSSSISGSISSQRSYGATRANLENADTKFLTHNVQYRDTLQRIAVKYGVSVEKLKSVNKIWSNESLFLLKTLKIPYVTQASKWEDESDEDESDEADDDENAKQSVEEVQDNMGQKDVKSKQQERREEEKTEINGLGKGAEKFENCKDFLSMIDNRINKCKEDWTKIRSHSDAGVLPCVSYDSSDANKLSPTKQCKTFTEQI